MENGHRHSVQSAIVNMDGPVPNVTSVCLVHWTTSAKMNPAGQLGLRGALVGAHGRTPTHTSTHQSFMKTEDGSPLSVWPLWES